MSSQYDLNNVERDVKHQIIIIQPLTTRYHINHMYLDRQACANSVEATECGISSGSTLFATRPAIFKHNIR